MIAAPTVEDTALEWRLEGSIIDYLTENVNPAPRGGFRHRQSSAPTNLGEYVSIGATKEENEPLYSAWWKHGVEVELHREDTEDTDAKETDAVALSQMWHETTTALGCMAPADLTVSKSHKVATPQGIELDEGEEGNDDNVRSLQQKLSICAGLLTP